MIKQAVSFSNNEQNIEYKTVGAAQEEMKLRIALKIRTSSLDRCGIV